MKSARKKTNRKLIGSYEEGLNAGRRMSHELLDGKLQFWFCLAWAFGFAAAASTYALVTRH